MAIGICVSGGLIVFATRSALCARVAGIGGGIGMFDSGSFSGSFDVENSIEELEESEDEGEGIFTAGVDNSSSIVFEAIVRSRSFRTSRTVR